MSNNKEAQAARSEATREVIDAHPEEFAMAMEKAMSKRGLVWNRRATPEERAQREQEERETKALARIAEIARKNGVSPEAANRALRAIAEGMNPEPFVNPTMQTTGLDALMDSVEDGSLSRLVSQAEDAAAVLDVDYRH